MVVNFIKNFFEQGYKLLAMRYLIYDRCVVCFNFFPISFLFVEITLFFLDGGPKIIKIVSILWMRFLILSENNKRYKKNKEKGCFHSCMFFYTIQKHERSCKMNSTKLRFIYALRNIPGLMPISFLKCMQSSPV